MTYGLFEYVDAKGAGAITAWRGGLQKAQQAHLDNKLNLLKRSGTDLSPKLVGGTKFGHIKKLKVKSNVQLRPRFCAGPIDHGSEYTFLVGAVERDWKTEPADADDAAHVRRLEILADNRKRRTYG